MFSAVCRRLLCVSSTPSRAQTTGPERIAGSLARGPSQSANALAPTRASTSDRACATLATSDRVCRDENGSHDPSGRSRRRTAGQAEPGRRRAWTREAGGAAGESWRGTACPSREGVGAVKRVASASAERGTLEGCRGRLVHRGAAGVRARAGRAVRRARDGESEVTASPATARRAYFQFAVEHWGEG